MQFEPTNSFNDNLALFKAKVEALDSECAKILFDNIDLLLVADAGVAVRDTVSKFNTAILAELHKLADTDAEARK
jgi:hypothetical protein